MKIYVRQHSETDYTGVEFDRVDGMVITPKTNHSLFFLTSSVESFIQYVVDTYIFAIKSAQTSSIIPSNSFSIVLRRDSLMAAKLFLFLVNSSLTLLISSSSISEN